MAGGGQPGVRGQGLDGRGEWRARRVSRAGAGEANGGRLRPR
jgi:hypothetical protein